MKETIYCQSCGMPLTKEEDLGTNADGSKNQEYCGFCYQEGKFAQDVTMDEMIALCAEYSDEFDPKVTKEEAIAMMKEYFPKLKRWQTS